VANVSNVSDNNDKALALLIMPASCADLYSLAVQIVNTILIDRSSL
jgi:hypothetical protein